MKWIVTNALNRDVEREHLNKILQDIADHASTTSNTVNNINSQINTTVLKSFTLKLAGDVTGSVTVNGGGVFTLNATLAEKFVEDAPNDNKAYLRKNKAWVLATTADVKEKNNFYFTADRAAEAVADAINAAGVDGVEAEYDSGTLALTIAGTGTGTGGVLPMVNGDVPPTLMYLEDGSLLYFEV